MGSAFHQLCPRYSGTLTQTAPTAIRLWKTFTFYLLLNPFFELGARDIMPFHAQEQNFLFSADY